jgi:uncharacterized protein (UPF0332 family)
LNTVPALIQKAKDSLHAARLLASEGLLDFALGRTYFTMHYVAMAFLLSQKLVVREPDAVVDAFGQRFARTNQLPAIFHRHLIEARRLMEQAEYETDAAITAGLVAEQLDRAKAFVSLGREELSNPAQ